MNDPNPYCCPYCGHFALDPDETFQDHAVYICLICGTRYTYRQLLEAEQMTREQILETFKPRVSGQVKAFCAAAVFILTLILFFVFAA
jgi:hypothetical protein